jgi:hypothetical protein
MTVRIEISEVPVAEQRQPRFQEVYDEMQTAFADRQFGRRVCLHEAAHSILMEQDGVKNVRFFGPEIIYDRSRENPFQRVDGRVRGDDDESIEVTKAAMFQKCVHSAAGGVALRKFAPELEEDTGDGNDYRKCWMRYEALRLKSGRDTLDETRKEFWTRAQDVANARLDDPDIKKKVLERTQGYLAILYPPSDWS